MSEKVYTEAEIERYLEPLRNLEKSGVDIAPLGVIEQLLRERDAALAQVADLERALEEGQAVWAEGKRSVMFGGPRRSGTAGKNTNTLTAAGGWCAPTEQLYTIGGKLIVEY